jgi:hypothetical protein
VNPITYCQFNYNDNFVASASDHGDILLTNVSSGESSDPLTGSDDSQVFLWYSIFICIIFFLTSLGNRVSKF